MRLCAAPMTTTILPQSFADQKTLPDQKRVGMVSLGCPKALVDSSRSPAPPR